MNTGHQDDRRRYDDDPLERVVEVDSVLPSGLSRHGGARQQQHEHNTAAPSSTSETFRVIRVTAAPPVSRRRRPR
jgi:hypothetical protein